MERNPCKTAIFAEQLPGQWQRRVDLFKFVVYGDPERLKNALSRVAGSEAGRRWDCLRDDLDQLCCRLDWAAFALADD